MDWKKFVGSIAPTLGQALGGPLGGTAGKYLAEALGVKDESAIEQALKKATPEQLKAIRDADQAFAAKMTELGIDLEKVNADDRASARHMQETTRSWVPGAIGIFLQPFSPGCWRCSRSTRCRPRTRTPSCWRWAW